MTVVSDTTPLHYLVLIGAANVLPALFGRVLIPEVVRAELVHPHAPSVVRVWTKRAPPWLDIHPDPPAPETPLTRLGAGEAAAITLAETLRADLVLLDERAGRAVAASRGLRVTGTLGVLDAAASRGLVALPDAVARLRATNARFAPTLLRDLLARHTER